MNPKQKRFTKIVSCVVLGSAWIFSLQKSLIQSTFGNLISGGVDLQQYINDVTDPSFRALWLLCLIGMLIWMSMAYRKRPLNAKEVLEMQPYWRRIALGLVGLGWLVLIIFHKTSNLKVNTLGTIFLSILVIVDVGILFWFPTMLASPKNYRLVVPGALRFEGGR